MKYRKKPVVIEAIRWTGDNLKDEFYPCKPDIFEKTCEPVYEVKPWT